VTTYDAAELQRLLEFWQSKGQPLQSKGEVVLSLAQMQALVEWDKTPEYVREELKTAIEEVQLPSVAASAAPLTPLQHKEAAEHGLLEEPKPASESLFGRLRSAIWPKR
jgi:hypothetical protein